MAGDRPIDPPTNPLDPYIEEAEARWDSVFARFEGISFGLSEGKRELLLLQTVEGLLDWGFSREILEDAIIDQCDKLIQDLAERLYSEANSTRGYD
jgi:hypothetical protein